MLPGRVNKRVHPLLLISITQVFIYFGCAFVTRGSSAGRMGIGRKNWIWGFGGVNWANLRRHRGTTCFLFGRKAAHSHGRSTLQRGSCAFLQRVLIRSFSAAVIEVEAESPKSWHSGFCFFDCSCRSLDWRKDFLRWVMCGGIKHTCGLGWHQSCFMHL